MKSKERRIAAAAVLTILGIAGHFLENRQTVLPAWMTTGILLAAWLLAGADVMKAAWVRLIHRKPIGEHFLMTVATLGAVALGEPLEAAMVMVLYQIGEALQERATDYSRKTVTSVMEMQAPLAYLYDEKTGQRTEVDAEEVPVGAILEIRSGERVPVDGTVISGISTLNVAALTGESMPVAIEEGASVLSGALNGQGRFLMRCDAVAEDSTASRIIALFEEATEHRAPTESFMTRFAEKYTPIVVILAIIWAILPPLILQQSFLIWLHRALSFLVVACPCAFVIAVPMTFISGMGAGAKRGILMKGGDVLERFAKVSQIALDKTGTMTTGEFSVQKVQARNISEEELLSLAGAIEAGATHPIAEAIRKKTGQKKSVQYHFEDIHEVVGRGMRAEGSSGVFIAGSRRFLEENQLDPGIFLTFFPEDLQDFSGTEIYVARLEPEAEILGRIEIADTLRKGAADAVRRMKKAGLHRVVMLSGDASAVVSRVGEEIGVDEAKGGLLPADKLQWVRQEIDRGVATAFVGDGLNDAPVLAGSSVGISLGGIGSDAAIEAADIVLMDDQPDHIASAKTLANRTMRVACQNIAFAIGVKVIAMLLTGLGIAPMFLAVFADVGVTLICLANALRIMLLQ